MTSSVVSSARTARLVVSPPLLRTQVALLLLSLQTGCFLLGDEPDDSPAGCPAGTTDIAGTCKQICDPETERVEGDGCVACDPSCEGRACGELSDCLRPCEGACYVWTKLETLEAEPPSPLPQGRGRACFVHLPDAEGGAFLLAGGWHLTRDPQDPNRRLYLQAEGTWLLEGRPPAPTTWRRIDAEDLTGTSDPAELPLRDATCARLPDGRVVAFGQVERAPDGGLLGDPPATVFLWDGTSFLPAEVASQRGAPSRSGGSLVVDDDGSVEWWFGCGPASRSTGEVCTWRDREGFSCREGPVFEREIAVGDTTQTVRLRGGEVARERESGKLLVQGGAFRKGSSCSTGADWSDGAELNETAWLVAPDGSIEALAAVGPSPRDAQRTVEGPAGVLVAGGADAGQNPTQFPEQTCVFDGARWVCDNDCRLYDEDRDGNSSWRCRPESDSCHGTEDATSGCGFSGFEDPALAANDEAYVLLTGWYDDASPYAGWVYARRDRLVRSEP